ncbi:MAG: glycosyltransferase [Verrucomicrobia bacterium]|nr:glycosyltransferase [Verrucomicrobiota bacterium]
MNGEPLKIVVLGLSITSSWGNGHATTYRGLMRELSARGHEVLFLERNTEWYESNRDMPKPPYGRTEIYENIEQLKERFENDIREADCVILGSYVPEGAVIGDWITRTAQKVKAFYDIDTPVTLANLENGDLDYLTRGLIPRYDLYLSFTGGPTLDRLEKQLGSPMARALHCSVDPKIYYPEDHDRPWDLGYLGTYSADRQPSVHKLLIEPAVQMPKSQFVVAGPQYPKEVHWPTNVERITHLAPAEHRKFYGRQCFTLNVTRSEMVTAGYSPSVRMFEAAACGTPIISDYWDGLDTFFELGEEVLVARSGEDVLNFMLRVPREDRVEIGELARRRVLKEHTAAHRASELEGYICELLRRPNGESDSLQAGPQESSSNLPAPFHQ